MYSAEHGATWPTADGYHGYTQGHHYTHATLSIHNGTLKPKSHLNLHTLCGVILQRDL